MTTTLPAMDQALQAPERRRWIESLIHRWPTALGIAFAILIAFDLESGSELYCDVYEKAIKRSGNIGGGTHEFDTTRRAA
jgi:hypothetical protein